MGSSHSCVGLTQQLDLRIDRLIVRTFSYHLFIGRKIFPDEENISASLTVFRIEKGGFKVAERKNRVLLTWQTNLALLTSANERKPADTTASAMCFPLFC